MRTLLPLVAAVALLAGGCATIHGYPVRESRGVETRQVGQILDPLLAALELPSLMAISTSSCKIGFAVVRTDKVNVWSTPGTTAPCLHFSLFVTEGALRAPADELTAMIAHELGHLVLQHVPQTGQRTAPSTEAWQAIQLQELEADRFAVALLKQLPAAPRRRKRPIASHAAHGGRRERAGGVGRCCLLVRRGESAPPRDARLARSLTDAPPRD